MPVYDSETNEPKKSATKSDDIAQKEEAASGDPAYTQNAGAGAEKERDFFKNEAANKHNASVGGFKGKLSGFSSKKIIAGGVGAGLITALIAVGSLFGFLNVFKLEHIMQSIEQRAFSRYQVSMDGRSDRWLRSYMRARVGEIDTVDGKTVDVNQRRSIFFTADKVDTNHPFTDWYRTLRTSKFEADLLREYGISFSGVATQNGDLVQFRSARINFSPKDGIDIDMGDFNQQFKDRFGTDFTIDTLNDPNGDKMRFLSERFDVEIEKFDSNKTARRAIKKAVNEKTHSWQVVKRRHIRKWIQNKTGVRSWRFFDKTRTRMEEKIISIRNRIIRQMFPDSTVLGKFIQCVFGVTACRPAADPGNPDTNADTSSNSSNRRMSDRQEEYPDPNDPNKTLTSGADDALDRVAKEGTEILGENLAEDGTQPAVQKVLLMGAKTEAAKAVLDVAKKLIPFANIIDMAETLNVINKMFKAHTITKLVATARGVQALALYTTYQTAADELKADSTGTTNEEVSALMTTIDSVSKSEGWVGAIDSPDSSAEAEGTVAFAKDRNEYCSDTHQAAIAANPIAYDDEFAYVCDDKKIGGSSLGASIESWWNNSVGLAISGLLTFWNSQGNVGRWLWRGLNWLLGEAVGIIIDGFKLLVPGSVEKWVGDTIDSMFGWVITKILLYIGAGPMLNGDEPSGVFANTIIQGATYAAESSSRNSGASLTNDESESLAIAMADQYYEDYYTDQSLFGRYFALDNPDSAMSKSLFASIENNTVNNVAGLFSRLVKTVGKLPMSFFSKPATAGSESAYAAANFAGIDTFDFPQQCYDLDPLTMTPQQATNVNNILSQFDVEQFSADELTWDILNDSEAFYNKMYSKIRDRYGDDFNTDAFMDVIELKGFDPRNYGVFDGLRTGEIEDFVGLGDVEIIAKQVYNCAALDTTVRGGLGYVYGYDSDNGLSANDQSTPSTGSCEGLTLVGPESGHGGSQVEGHDQYQLPADNPGYYIYPNNAAQRESQWGRKELIQTIWQVGLKWAELHPGIKFGVGDLDQSDGHVSHVKGINVDISGCPMMSTCSDYNQDYAIELAKLFFDTSTLGSILYNDVAVQNAVNTYVDQNDLNKNALSNGYAGDMHYYDNHDNHFHVTVVPGITPKGCE